MIRTQPISTLTDTLCPCTTLFRAACLRQATLVVPGVDLGDPQHAGAREARPADPSRLPAAAAILGAGPQHPHARAQLLGAVGTEQLEPPGAVADQLGRATCRERVCQYV